MEQIKILKLVKDTISQQINVYTNISSNIIRDVIKAKKDTCNVVSIWDENIHVLNTSIRVISVSLDKLGTIMVNTDAINKDIQHLFYGSLSYDEQVTIYEAFMKVTKHHL